MKKIISILALLLCMGLTSMGQEANGDSKFYDCYCAFYGKAMLNGKVKPQKIIWGDTKKEVILTSSEGKEIEFNNMIDVANYMSKRGWVYIDCKVYHDTWVVIYKKTIRCDSEAKEGLYFDIDFK